MSDIQKILRLLDKLVDLEETIENDIKKERDAKRRDNLRKGIRRRDVSLIRDMLFNPDN